jgi:hypothetical protein
VKILSFQPRDDDFRSNRQARNLFIGEGLSGEARRSVCGLTDHRKDKAMNTTPPKTPAATDIEREQLDTTNPEALRESARLGNKDAYLVKTDLEDADQREDGDQPDGHASPMANADNAESG